MASPRLVAALAAVSAFVAACDAYTVPEGPDASELVADGGDAADPGDAPDGAVDTPPGPLTLTVVRAGGAPGAITSDPGGIDCGATCAASFEPGTVVTLTAVPGTGAELTGWSGGGCTGTGACVLTLAAATTVTATFARPSFPVTVTLGGNGGGRVTGGAIDCPGACTTSQPFGAQLTLAAAPAAGSIFTGWSGACSGTGTCVVTVAGAVDVTANFALNQTLIVATSGNGRGTVTSNPAGIACGADCDQTYPPGTAVTLSAAAAPDSIFTGWSGGGCTGTGTCVVTVDAALQVTAGFALRQYRLDVTRTGTGAGTVSSAPGGISCGADCAELYDVGTMVTLTATPAVNARFTGWSGAGCSGTGSCVVTVAGATAVTADFAPILHTLTVMRAGTGGGSVTSNPAGITCGTDCTEDVPQGAMVTLTATASVGATFAGWSGGGCGGTGTCTVSVAAATTVTATFAITPYPLTVTRTGAGAGTVSSTPAGITCGADCGADYDHGTVVTLTATASAGSTFAGWSGGGCGGTGSCVVTLTAATAVSAAFTLDPLTLTVAKSGTGAGAIVSSPGGITCGADCAEAYPSGTMVTLTATPATGSTFGGWSGGGCTGTGTCTVSVTAATTVTASFTITPYPLTVTKSGTGSGAVVSTPGGITCGGDCTEPYDHGTSVTLTATPAVGSAFAGWSGACSGTGTCVVAVTAATAVTATFTLVPATLTVAKAGAGAGTITSIPAGITCGADCAESYPYNTVVTLTAAPATGSTFTGWAGGGCTGTGTCVTTITAATAVSATFALIPYPLTVTRTGAGAGTITSTPAGITCGTACSADYDHGTVVTLTATPAAGSTFGGWSGGGCAGTGSCVVTLTAATAVSAAFTLDPLALTVTRSGTGAGTVTSSPGGIACGADCTEAYGSGTTVTLTAAPAIGSTFTGWSGGGCSGAGTCTVTVAAALTVTATFATIEYPLTVSASGNGAGTVTSAPAGVSCGADCSEPFGYGTAVTLTAAPATGSTFGGWSGGGCSGTGTCVTTVTAATAVTATFTLIPSTLTVTKSGTGVGTVTSAPAGINCGADCAEPYDYGTAVTLSAAPGTGSTFTGWSGGGCSGTGTCVTTVTAATTVTATFALIPYTLTVARSGAGTGTVTSAPAGISCGADCSEPVNYGTAVTLTAAPATGSTFGGWSGGGCSGTGTCVTTVTAATTVTATFTLTPYTLTVAKSGTGAGSVTSTPTGISCGSDCSQAYSYGTSVTLMATPATGSMFNGWSGGGCSGTGTCVTTVTAAATVTATFTLIPQTLAVAKTGTGAGTVVSSPTGISCGADCSQSYGYGTSVTLTATASTGSTFTGWSGGGCTGTGTCIITVTAATTVTAGFAINPYTLTVAKTGTGAGTVTSAPAGISCGADCAEPYNYGTSVTLTAAAATGSTFSGWSGGGCTGTGTCVTTVTAATTVTATFTMNYYTLMVTKAGTGSGTVYGPNSSCGPTCPSYTISVLYNTPVTMTQAEATGSVFTGWGGVCSGTGACTFTMSQDRAVSATFTAGAALTVQPWGTGVGNVTATGIACGIGGGGGTDCSQNYLLNTAVTLTVSVAAGSVFTGWSGGGCSGTATTCTTTMSASQTVRATVEAVRTLNVSTTGSGTITSNIGGISCGGTCAGAFAHGSVVTLTATPESHSQLVTWTGACAAAGTSPTCTITMDANKTVGATFLYTLVLWATGNGHFNVTAGPPCEWAFCYYPVAGGTTVTYTAVPDPGYHWATWNNNNNTCQGQGSTCTFTVGPTTPLVEAGAFSPN